MDDYTKLGIEDFLNQLADRTPTPGGGAVTGLAGALACAMARMVAAYSVKKSTEPAVRSQIEDGTTALRRADQLLRASFTQDAQAYLDMTAAAKAAREDPKAKPAYEQAVLRAIAVPMEMAAIASNALSSMDEMKAVASQYLLSDLGIAAVLAWATTRTARYSVLINARELTDNGTRARILADIDRIVDHCECARASIEAFVGHSLADAGHE